MKKGFLTSTRKGSVASSSTTVTATPTTGSSGAPPPGFHTSPSAHPSSLHWSFYPSSSPAAPTAHLALHITSHTRSLLPPTSTFNAETPSLIPDPPLWEMRDLKGKGVGLVAVRDIPEGVVLFRERPLLVYDPEPGRAPKDHELEKVLQHAVAHLKPTAQATLLSLTNVFPSTLGPLTGILRTNAYPCITLPSDTQNYFGLFELFSRLNHSCEPNTLPEFLPGEFMLQIKTRRAIKKGEELCTAYILTMQPRFQRLEELRVKYKFECDCPWCSLSDEESEKKDREREQVAKAFMAQFQPNTNS